MTIGCRGEGRGSPGRRSGEEQLEEGRDDGCYEQENAGIEEGARVPGVAAHSKRASPRGEPSAPRTSTIITIVPGYVCNILLLGMFHSAWLSFLYSVEVCRTYNTICFFGVVVGMFNIQQYLQNPY